MNKAPIPVSGPESLSRTSRRCAGVTLVEILLFAGLVVLILALAVPGLRGHLDSRRIAEATLEIERIDALVVAFRERHHRLPESLSELQADVPLDPWGQPYRYLALHRGIDAAPRTDSRQDSINTDFDLYSVGPDGASTATVVATQSRDDVIRAHDGRYIGPASQH